MDIGKTTAFWTTFVDEEEDVILAMFYDDEADLIPMNEVTSLFVRYIMDLP